MKNHEKKLNRETIKQRINNRKTEHEVFLRHFLLVTRLFTGITRENINSSNNNT